MKKVVVLSLQLYGGGIEKYATTLANLLVGNYEVELVSLYKHNDKKIFHIDSKVKVTYLSNDYPDKISLKKLLKDFKIKDSFLELKRRKDLKKTVENNLCNYFKNLNTDYIITTRIYLNEMVNKYLQNNKIIKIATDHNYPNGDDYIKSLTNSIQGFDYLILSTHELVDLYKDKIGKTKCLYMANCLDNIEKVKSPLSNKNIISVGRFSPEKGFLDLIEVFNEVNKIDPKIKLFLLGDGYQKEEIISLINKYNLEKNIILPGFIDSKAQKKYYLKSSLYVMTSFTEAFGLVLIESMNNGVPCIAFDSASGARELLKNDVGILIQNRDKKAMALKIIELLNDNKKLKYYVKNINKNINNFYAESIYKNWRKILK